MRRSIVRTVGLVAWAGLGMMLLGAGTSPPSTAPEFSQGELEALRREVQRSVELVDPFEGGPAPDLVVLTSTNVHGETAPCG